MNAFDHSLLSSHRYGGEPEQYLPLHTFIDSSKKWRYHHLHRMMLHHNLGAHLAEKIIGLSVGSTPTRDIVYSHIKEDCGAYITIQQWLDQIVYPDTGEEDNFPYSLFEEEVLTFCNGDTRILYLMRTDFGQYLSYKWQRGALPEVQPVRISEIEVKVKPFMMMPTSKSDIELVNKLKLEYNESRR